MNTHGFELKSFGLEIVNDLPGYWTGLMMSTQGELCLCSCVIVSTTVIVIAIVIVIVKIVHIWAANAVHLGWTMLCPLWHSQCISKKHKTMHQCLFIAYNWGHLVDVVHSELHKVYIQPS